MTGDQLAGMSMTDPHHSTASVEGNRLGTWSDENTGDSFGVTWMVAMSAGLSLAYSERADGQGTCSLSVGVSDSLFFMSTYDSEHGAPKAKTCQLAEQAASDVNKNLGGVSVPIGR